MTQSNLTFTEGHEIPEGCKNTELGIFPEPWKLMTIQEALDTKYLLDQMDGNHGELYPRSNEFSQSGIAYIGATDFSDNKVDFKNCKFLPLIRAKKFRKGIAKSGDVLFAHNATVGPAALLKTDDEFVILSTTATYYRCNDKHLSNQYLLSFFESNAFKQQYTAVMSQSTRNQVSILAQRKFKLVLPSREEQEKIATALSDTDALISELEKLIEKKQAIKTATMQQLLTGKTRLPEFALREDGMPKGYKESELGQIPEDWDVYKVGEISDVLTGFPFPSSHYTDSGVRLLRGSNVKRGVTDWSEDITQYWPIISSDIKKYELKVGDIVISMDGSLVGRSFAQLDKSDLPAVLLQRVARVRSSDVDQNYLKQWICSEMFTAHCDAVKTVTAIPHISPDDIKTFRFVAPKCKKEQKQLSGILKDMEVEIQILNEKLTKLIMFKKGMMQELLTGKTRLV